MTRLEALARHPLAIAGAVITTASAVVFIALVIAMLAGMFTNPYAGLVVFVGHPRRVRAGTAAHPGRACGCSGASCSAIRRPSPTGRSSTSVAPTSAGRRSLIAALTAVNIVIILLAGYGGLHWMESPTFCGQACHTPMQPQFTAWQGAAHARRRLRRAATSAKAPRAFVHAKLAGVRQLVDGRDQLVSEADSARRRDASGRAGADLPRLPPARSASIGDRIRVIREYADDEANTETMTVLQMHVGAATVVGARDSLARRSRRSRRVRRDRRGAPDDSVRQGDRRERPGEGIRRAGRDRPERSARATAATMDCIDCHNTVGHPISPTPEQAVDRGHRRRDW